MSPTETTYLAAAAYSAAMYGLADFLGGYATRSVPTDATVLVQHLAGLPLVLIAAVAGASSPTWSAIGYGAIAGLAAALGLRLLYRALAAGPMAVVAPVAAILSASVPVAAGLLLGHRATFAALVGGVAAGAAIVLLTGGRPSGRASARTLAATGVSGLLFGLTDVLLSRVDATGGLWSVVAMIGTVCLVAAVGVLRLPRDGVELTGGQRALLAAVGAGVALAAAAIATQIAVRGNLITVGPLLALYPAATVLCAVTVTRERVSFSHAFGLVWAGVAVIALARS